MGTSRADVKKPILRARAAQDAQEKREGDDGHELVDLNGSESAARKTVEECLEAMSHAPLRMTLPWQELRKITREP